MEGHRQYTILGLHKLLETEAVVPFLAQAYVCALFQNYVKKLTANSVYNLAFFLLSHDTLPFYQMSYQKIRFVKNARLAFTLEKFR